MATRKYMFEVGKAGRLGEAVTRLKARMAHDPDFAAKVQSLDPVNNIDFQEHFAYQNAQAQGFARGKLTQSEATFIYRSLGAVWTPTNGGWARGVDPVTKIVITKTVGELLGVS